MTQVCANCDHTFFQHSREFDYVGVEDYTVIVPCDDRLLRKGIWCTSFLTCYGDRCDCAEFYPICEAVFEDLVS